MQNSDIKGSELAYVHIVHRSEYPKPTEKYETIGASHVGVGYVYKT